jgi:hypothetical protein
MGNAAVAGMAEDLELYTEGRYNIAVMIFFIPVCPPPTYLTKSNELKLTQ